MFVHNVYILHCVGWFSSGSLYGTVLCCTWSRPCEGGHNTVNISLQPQHKCSTCWSDTLTYSTYFNALYWWYTHIVYTHEVRIIPSWHTHMQWRRLRCVNVCMNRTHILSEDLSVTLFQHFFQPLLRHLLPSCSGMEYALYWNVTKALTLEWDQYTDTRVRS